MSRVAFLGTPQPALATLKALHESLGVDLVITQPDRPRGRSATPMPSPVRAFAEEVGIEVRQPVTQQGLAEALASASPLDVGVVVAYGRILDHEVLAIPRRGFLNVHFSLLPRWRGASPVARALIEGDTMTGVTIFRLDEGVDTGPVLTAQAVDILGDENRGDLTGRLSEVGAALMQASLPGYLAGEIEPIRQSDEGATHAPKLTKADRALQLGDTAKAFTDRVRGLAPTPGATLVIDGLVHKILRAGIHKTSPDEGTWVGVEGIPVVAVGGGGVAIESIQPPGKKPMTGDEWLRGRRVTSGLVG